MIKKHFRHILDTVFSKVWWYKVLERLLSKGNSHTQVVGAQIDTLNNWDYLSRLKMPMLCDSEIFLEKF